MFNAFVHEILEPEAEASCKDGGEPEDVAEVIHYFGEHRTAEARKRIIEFLVTKCQIMVFAGVGNGISDITHGGDKTERKVYKFVVLRFFEASKGLSLVFF